MSRVSALAAAGRSPTAKFHELRLRYWNLDIDAICCLEGSDDVEFYLPHVRRELSLHSERIDFLVCAGKSVVLQLFQWCSDRMWNFARLGFFVDRDIDDYLAGNLHAIGLYLTDNYSIESHVVDDAFFDSVWQDSFRLSLLDGRRRQWQGAYYAGAQEFARLLRPLMYTALAAKRAGVGVDFDKVKIEDLISVSSSGDVRRRARSKGSDYSKVFIDCHLQLADIRAARLELTLVTYAQWLRGKYLLWYSMTFFSRMKAALGAKGVERRAVVRTHFNEENGVACLCGRTAMPQSLEEFLGGWAFKIADEGVVATGE